MRIAKKITAFLLMALMLVPGSVKAYASMEDEEKVYLEVKNELAAWMEEFGFVEERHTDEADAFLTELSTKDGDYIAANKDEIEKEFKIKMLLGEMQLFELERYMQETAFRETETDGKVIAAEKARLIEEYNKKTELYEAELEKLGLHTVEPMNPEDTQMLNEMQDGMVSKKDGFSVSDRTGFSRVPDFTLIALGVLGIAAFISLCRRKKGNIC